MNFTVVVVVQVANTKKETIFKWYKDGVGLDVKDLPDLQKELCSLTIPKVWCNDSVLNVHGN